MKKFAIFTLVLALGAAMLTGCGCMNTNADVTTLPTNGETVTPSRPTSAPTTMPTTAPTTEAATEGTTDTTGTLEGAMDDILGGSTDDATTGNGGSMGGDGGTNGGNGGNGGSSANGRSGGMDMGRGRTNGNGPRRK